jgi:hypothetical protein
LQERVLKFLALPGSEPFESLALDLFAYQYANNPAYRSWCDSLGVAPGRVAAVDDIPAVPAQAFRELDLACGPPAAEFRTSGTSGGGHGRHLVPSLEPYRASALAWFGRCVMPEGWKLRTLALAVPPEKRPSSSLSRMLGWVIGEFGEPGSGWFAGEDGVANDRLAEALLDAARTGTPVLVLAASAALARFLSYCESSGVAVRLPGGSRLMDTGGLKGAVVPGPVPSLRDFQAGLYRRVTSVLGIPEDRCVNEYGMTELSSQLYDSTVLDRHEGREPGSPPLKLAPPWLRVTAVDPATLRPVAPGEAGVLRFTDLANAGSVLAVLTEDIGRILPGGLELLGRPAAAEARGCGLDLAPRMAAG